MHDADIIRARSIDFAVLDECAYYEAIYAGNDSVPNRAFYQIDSPFWLDTQFVALSRADSRVNARSKRKRPQKASSCCVAVEKILEKAVALFASELKGNASVPYFRSNDSLKSNNYDARKLAISASSTPCLLSHYEEQYFVSKHDVKEIFLSEKNCNITDIANEIVMWKNASLDVLTIGYKDQKYILPPMSSFIINDVSASTALIKQRKRFDFILLDPPWPNGSVKRKNVYHMCKELTSVLELCVPELLLESGLFATWVTNNEKFLKFVDDMIEHFGLEKIATWRWLKVTNSLEPISAFNSHHKLPFENIVFACHPSAVSYYVEIVDEFVLISTPSAIHSRKPPLFPILQALGFIKKSAEQLELYGRYLLPQTTTIGFESCKLQNRRYFI
ncbi:unnamed protein product [Thelazia callipaeda]|uniref:MT-A70 family protein n=1 Tax=Thelazia callipaeda TaxID=103827 RepID=A0A0N5CWS0_THECL|nr:unnamed protein product [Thelazia callipaeda]